MLSPAPVVGVNDHRPASDLAGGTADHVGDAVNGHVHSYLGDWPCQRGRAAGVAQWSYRRSRLVGLFGE